MCNTAHIFVDKEKKRKVDQQPSLGNPLRRPVFPTSSKHDSSRVRSSSSKLPAEQFKKLPPSNLIKKLANATRNAEDEDAPESSKRSTSFTARPETEPPPDYEAHASNRDDRLALVENLEPGPYEHVSPSDDPNFEKLEPHSGIALMYEIMPPIYKNVCFLHSFLLGRASFLMKNFLIISEQDTISRHPGFILPFDSFPTNKATMYQFQVIGLPSL